eukprot:GHUV01038880.1.p1 GENE.GHUV01038880.1~~GHUV01038880.1.p1  ORF type:complete len:204 (+),score=50.56 GHUV01038880.1:292-903(+)
MAKAGSIRGLQVFIGDIRACQNKEQETKRVDKELAKIRAKFGDEKKTLTAYDRKKYVWKLLYIYMLGYDVEFGHKQACDLIPSQKYSEKQVGYMACSILMNEKDEFLRLAINGIHNDLVSRNEAFQSLALTFVGNSKCYQQQAMQVKQWPGPVPTPAGCPEIPAAAMWGPPSFCSCTPCSSCRTEEQECILLLGCQLLPLNTC